MEMIRSISIIGAGKMGSALSAVCVKAGYKLLTVVDLDKEKAERIRRRDKGQAALDSIVNIDSYSDLWFIAVPDDALETMARSIGSLRTDSIGKGVVHTSGLHTSSILEPVRNQGVWIGSFHPCFSFPESFKGDLKDVPVAVEGDEAGLVVMEAMARRLGAKCMRIDAASKPIYHAACTMASGGLVALVDVLRLMKDRVMGEEGLEWLFPLMEGTMEHIRTRGVQDALTGPVIRGDTGTVEQHLEALKCGPAPAFELYMHLAYHASEITEHILSEKGALQSIRSMLDRYAGKDR